MKLLVQNSHEHGNVLTETASATPDMVGLPTGKIRQAATAIFKNGIEAGETILDELGYTRLDKGIVATTRYVFETDKNTVIKIPMNEDHKFVNKNESTTWQHLKDKRALAPILQTAEDFAWIEMEKCYRVNRSDKSIERGFEKKMSQREYEVLDIHLDNIGILPSNREIVCFDYAAVDWHGTQPDNRSRDYYLPNN